ncbi:MAG: tRNA threonylcarbamoyladenosine dehydratase [Elusimicrobia bacterium]|nr:tRNA threonylcarbamoyladenosine dehydratase [Elusimicrobiota bacterium]
MDHKAVPNPMEDPQRRFDRLQRLVGPEAMARLRRSHVMVVGAGGVGSWAAESVARSGVGRLTVVDFDTVCIRNFNRQLQALSGCIGKPKAPLLAERLRLANPEADVRAVAGFFNRDTCDGMLADRPDFVIDAIDHVTSKCFLIHTCRERAIPLVVSTGSGGRLDPTLVRVADLARTDVDPLARALRDILREKYGFPKRALFGVKAVWSPEPPSRPHETMDETDCKAGCLCPQGENAFQSCTKKSLVMGTASFVTGAFGFVCASVAVRTLIGDDPYPDP